ncbi:hypothetical protein [Streptomyces boncukensis]|uniref:Uncharacterized protein n=1 Tax=Streptomyces boncukensis TaxID=2711219 RepID=A0A6G4WTX1_9ACTN|nr:hypothetical protein [Streptomyces boncukensis]NGO68558.1 hypothetical protein [Streptomyces boncukensis]
MTTAYDSTDWPDDPSVAEVRALAAHIAHQVETTVLADGTRRRRGPAAPGDRAR